MPNCGRRRWLRTPKRDHPGRVAMRRPKGHVAFRQTLGPRDPPPTPASRMPALAPGRLTGRPNTSAPLGPAPRSPSIAALFRSHHLLSSAANAHWSRGSIIRAAMGRNGGIGGRGGAGTLATGAASRGSGGGGGSPGDVVMVATDAASHGGGAGVLAAACSVVVGAVGEIGHATCSSGGSACASPGAAPPVHQRA